MRYRHHRNGSLASAIFAVDCNAFLLSRLGPVGANMAGLVQVGAPYGGAGGRRRRTLPHAGEPERVFPFAVRGWRCRGRGLGSRSSA